MIVPTVIVSKETGRKLFCWHLGGTQTRLPLFTSAGTSMGGRECAGFFVGSLELQIRWVSTIAIIIYSARVLQWEYMCNGVHLWLPGWKTPHEARGCHADDIVRTRTWSMMLVLGNKDTSSSSSIRIQQPGDASLRLSHAPSGSGPYRIGVQVICKTRRKASI